MRPTRGWAVVLKTIAPNGPAGSRGKVSACSVCGFTATTGAACLGDGGSAPMASSKVPIPIDLPAAVQRTGTIAPAATPLASAPVTSASLNSPLSRYFSSSASSVSAAGSTGGGLPQRRAPGLDLGGQVAR